MTAETARAPRGGFLKDGEPVPVALEVRSYKNTGFQFSAYARRTGTDLVVIHWTGSENAPGDLFRHLRAINNSVHFVVDQLGVVWQMGDTSWQLSHAQGVNNRAVGIEVINRGSSTTAPDKGFERDAVQERIHGRPVAYRDFLPAQVRSVLVLTEALCAAYGLPYAVPMLGTDVHPGALDKRALRAFRGVVGHYNTKTSKLDPGVRLMRTVHAHLSALRTS